MKKVFVCCSIILILSSCYSPKTLERALNKEQYALWYLHDYPQREDKFNVSILPEIIDNTDGSYVTSVYKDYGRYSYYVIFCTYEYDMTVSLGKNSIVQNLKEFVELSFNKESEISGRYYMNDTSKDLKYKIRVDISDYNVESKYHISVVGGGDITASNVNIEPSNGYLKMTATLINLMNDKEVYTKEYISEKKTNFGSSRVENIMQINTRMMDNMLGSLSNCIKEDISRIVSDINNQIEQIEN